MPTRLNEATAANLSGFGRIRAGAKAAAAEVMRGFQNVSIRGPFAGFTPDIDANKLDPTAMNRMTNCLGRTHGADHGEVLGLPDGYRQIDSARLPLGDGS